MSWKRRVKIGLGAVLAAVVIAGLWFARRLTIEQMVPGLELDLRGYDGKTYPARTSGQEEWVGAVMDAPRMAVAETDSK